MTCRRPPSSVACSTMSILWCVTFLLASVLLIVKASEGYWSEEPACPPTAGRFEFICGGQRRTVCIVANNYTSAFAVDDVKTFTNADRPLLLGVGIPLLVVHAFGLLVAVGTVLMEPGESREGVNWERVRRHDSDGDGGSDGDETVSTAGDPKEVLRETKIMGNDVTKRRM